MFGFITNTLLPVLILLLLGWVFFRIKMLNEGFIEAGSKLVFNAALPALLFLSISQADFSHAANFRLIMTGAIATLAFFLLLMLFCHFTVSPPNARGVVTQGGFRANMGIIGLAYCTNTYGNDGLAAASVYLGCITILFNVLSVFVLNFYLDGKRSVRQHIKGIVTNPLIIGILLALPISYWQIQLPEVLIRTGKYFFATNAAASAYLHWSLSAIPFFQCRLVQHRYQYPVQVSAVSWLYGVIGLFDGI